MKVVGYFIVLTIDFIVFYSGDHLAFSSMYCVLCMVVTCAL